MHYIVILSQQLGFSKYNANFSISKCLWEGPKNWITLDGSVRVPVELLDEVSADEVAGPVHAVGAVDSHERIWNEVSVRF